MTLFDVLNMFFNNKNSSPLQSKGGGVWSAGEHFIDFQTLHTPREKCAALMLTIGLSTFSTVEGMQARSTWPMPHWHDFHSAAQQLLHSPATTQPANVPSFVQAGRVGGFWYPAWDTGGIFSWNCAKSHRWDMWHRAYTVWCCRNLQNFAASERLKMS